MSSSSITKRLFKGGVGFLAAFVVASLSLVVAIPQNTKHGNVAVTTRQISPTFDCPVQESADGQVYVLPCNDKTVEKRNMPSTFVVNKDGTGSYLGRTLTVDQVSRVLDHANSTTNGAKIEKRQNWIAGVICLGDLWDCENGYNDPSLLTPPLLYLDGAGPTPLQCTEWLCTNDDGWCPQNYAPAGPACASDRPWNHWKRNFINFNAIPDLTVYPDGSGIFQNLTIPKEVVDRIIDRHAEAAAMGPTKMRRQDPDTTEPGCGTPDQDIICQWQWEYCQVTKTEYTDYDCDNWACSLNNGWCDWNDAGVGCFCQPGEVFCC